MFPLMTSSCFTSTKPQHEPCAYSLDEMYAYDEMFSTTVSGMYRWLSAKLQYGDTTVLYCAIDNVLPPRDRTILCAYLLKEIMTKPGVKGSIYLVHKICCFWSIDRSIERTLDVMPGIFLLGNQFIATVKPVYNDHLTGYFPAFWSSSRWPRAT